VSTEADRPGDWFPKQRLYLLIDPHTGMLLAGEAVGLTVDEQAVGTSVQVPTTIGYQVWFPGVFVADKNAQPFLGGWQGAGTPPSVAPSVRGRAWCFRAADLASAAEPVGAGAAGEGQELGPVEVCAQTWQTDRYGWVTGTPGTRGPGAPTHTVPALVACVVQERVPGTEANTVVGVFPGDGGTCAALGLPRAE
jgi:hypothetical protein